jgi:hypothetical protein
MPAKPKKKTTDNRLQIRYDADWLARINLWRRRQPDPIPNLSEAIRRLVEKGLKK